MNAPEVRVTAASSCRAAVGLALGAAAAVGLGLFADLGQYWDDPWGYLPQLAAPWVLLGIGLGSCLRSPARAALAGGIGLLAAMAVYFAFKHAAYDTQIFVGGQAGANKHWLLAAAAIGAVAGAVGSGCRQPDPWGACCRAAALAAPAAEGLALFALIAASDEDTSIGYLALGEFAVAIAVFTWMIWRPPRTALALAFAGWLTAGALAGLAVYRHVVG